jgi:nucleotide-binding universal stress UspA family protein
VIVVRKRILVPTDGSEQAERAGEQAISMAESEGAEIIVLYVIDTDYLRALPQDELINQIKAGLKVDGEKAVADFQKTLEDKQCEGHCSNIQFRTMIKEGKPAEVILKTIESEGIDQVVMGKSGKHGIERLVLGRTTERVVRRAKVSVEVVA